MFAISLHIILGIDAAEFMRTDSDFGELFLVQNKTMAGDWSVLYIEKGIYFKQESSRSFCVEYSTYYRRDCSKYKDFFPTNLTVHQSSQTSFPIGLFQFWVFKRLQNLQISNVGISEFRRSGLIGADGLNILDLSRNALLEMPAQAFSSASNLTEVDLSHNQIASMASDVFKEVLNRTLSESIVTALPNASSSLKIIRLHNNHLTLIDPEWFSNLRYLTTLTLNDNFLIEISACSALNTNIALRILQLQKNELSRIITTGFFGDQCLSQLDAFDVSDNPKNANGGTISVNAKEIIISNTNSLQCQIPQIAIIFRASHNRINSVLVDFPNTQLLALYLDHNEIDSAHFLLGLECLEVIDISHNQLTQISAKFFENMVNLISLNISHNKFSAIDFAFVRPPSGLKYLDISNNLLSGHFNLTVEANALAELNIANNNYTSLQLNLRKYLPSLTHIDLNNNYFECEDLKSILLFMHFDHIKPVTQSGNELSDADNVRGIKCHHPNSDANKSTKNSIKTTKDEIIEMIDDKMGNMEVKLIDLFKNMTSKVVNN